MTEQGIDNGEKKRSRKKLGHASTPVTPSETPLPELLSRVEPAQEQPPRSARPPWDLGISRDLPPTPLEQAQELIYAAWEASGRTRIKLARKALALSRDCADAYVLLGDETASTLEDARALYEQGVKAGERVLGPQAFEGLVGDFWDELDARPYMRARYALADCLWALGQSREAIAHLSDMLRLNPGDNQGIRFILARYLLETDADKALGELLDRFGQDHSTFWAYTRALHTYRAEGASFRAEVQLKTALCANYHVPVYLLSRRPLPTALPGSYSLGQEDEAMVYASEFVAGWAQSDDALDWLADHTVSPHLHRGH